jgi:Domain of unknown function (DUF4266)
MTQAWKHKARGQRPTGNPVNSSNLHRAGWGLVMLTLTVLQAGCAYAPPKPWEKDLLARPAMTLDADPLDRRFTQHVYASKENSSGGEGVGGGGCGCN